MNKLRFFVQSAVGAGIGLAVLFVFGQIGALPVLSSVAGCAGDEPADAIVKIDRTQWDFGELRSGDVTQAAFEIRNVGRSRLILRKTNGDCDCVSTGEAEIIVEPGGRQTIVAELDSNKVRVP